MCVLFFFSSACSRRRSPTWCWSKWRREPGRRASASRRVSRCSYHRNRYCWSPGRRPEWVERCVKMCVSLCLGLVESSTDNYRGVQPFDDTSQSSVNPPPDEQERASDVSEVSRGHALLWTAGGGGYCQDGGLPGPSSGCVPVPYLPAAQPGEELGSVRALAPQSPKGRGLTENCRRYFQETPLIHLPQESRPIQALGFRPQQFLDPGPHRVPKKKLCICRFCSKLFSSPANLESHLRTHTGERPYGCTICGKKFSQFWNLKIHKNIHTGERPYQCPLCAERFSDPSNLKKHQKRHHPQT